MCASLIGITALHALRTILTLGSVHFTWTTLLAQQAQVAALVDTAQRQRQAYMNLKVCASPMTISVSHSRFTLITRATTNPTLP